VVYTQPVFDHAAADRAAACCRALGVPCLIGVLPLRSQRHAEFMHNEVPGIDVPEWLRARIATAADDASALEIGIEEAQRLTAHIRTIAEGVYLMPPFGSHVIAERVMQAL
jgi:methionine synthase / methylenetetrahydrofolate reductase(NADPH)